MRYSQRYLSTTSQDESWGFYVTSVGHSSVKPGARYPLPGHPEEFDFDWTHGRVLDDFVLLLIVQGDGEFQTKRYGKIKLGAGDILTLPPRLLHRYRPEMSVGWEEYWVTFNGHIPSGWLKSKLLDPLVPRANCKAGQSTVELFEELHRTSRLATQQQKTLAWLTHGLIQQTLTALEVDHPSRSKADHLRLAADAIRNGSKRFSLEAASRSAGMRPSTFRRAFQKEFGITPARFAEEETLKLAKQALSMTDEPIRVIAKRLDFLNEFYFMRAFKRNTGMTATAWRKRVRADHTE